MHIENTPVRAAKPLMTADGDKAGSEAERFALLAIPLVLSAATNLQRDRALNLQTHS